MSAKYDVEVAKKIIEGCMCMNQSDVLCDVCRQRIHRIITSISVKEYEKTKIYKFEHAGRIYQLFKKYLK